MRRLRRSDRLRALVRETRLDLDDFVLPLFVGPATEANPDLPALGRFSVDDLVAEVTEAQRLGVRAVLLFGIPDEKDADGSGAWDDDGVIQRDGPRAAPPTYRPAVRGTKLRMQRRDD